MSEFEATDQVQGESPPGQQIPRSVSVSTSLSGSTPGRTLYERGATLFKSGLYSDVTFVIEEPIDDLDGSNESGNKKITRIPAHKVYLASSSEVFAAMLFGSLREQEEIRITDFSSEIFLIMLKFIYTEEAEITKNTAIETLYAAEKYFLPRLSQIAVDYLESFLEPQNAFHYLMVANKFKIDRLQKSCLRMIELDTIKAFESDFFFDIDCDVLRAVLSRDSLDCEEIDIFHYASQWAEEECLRQGIAKDAITGKDKRNVLADALHLIRMPTMSVKDFASGPALSGILTEEETINLFIYLGAQINENHIPFPFSCRTRRGHPHMCNRFIDSDRIFDSQARLNIHAIEFSVNKPIFLVGYRIYSARVTSVEWTHDIDLQVKLERENESGIIETLAESQQIVPVVDENCENETNRSKEILFPQPVLLKANVSYIASTVMSKDCVAFDFWRGKHGKSQVTVRIDSNTSFTFQFRNSNISNTLTNVKTGQIPTLLFYDV